MKRHPALEPFSRDHNDGLILARALQLQRPNAEEMMREAWELELKDHFDEEERLLSKLCEPTMLGKMLQDHQVISRLIHELPRSMSALGNALHDHIRWEERELFPWIEEHATAGQLESLANDAEPMEMRRWDHDTRRKELVSRRWQ